MNERASRPAAPSARGRRQRDPGHDHAVTGRVARGLGPRGTLQILGFVRLRRAGGKVLEIDWLRRRLIVLDVEEPSTRPDWDRPLWPGLGLVFPQACSALTSGRCRRTERPAPLGRTTFERTPEARSRGPGRTVGRSTVFSGPRLAHREAAAHEGLTVETPDGFLGVGALAELHEGEASRATGLTVDRHHDLGGYSHRRQVLTQLCFRGPVGKVSDEQPNRQSLPRVVRELLPSAARAARPERLPLQILDPLPPGARPLQARPAVVSSRPGRPTTNRTRELAILFGRSHRREERENIAMTVKCERTEVVSRWPEDSTKYPGRRATPPRRERQARQEGRSKLSG